MLGRRRLTKALVVAQLVALLGFGALTVARFHVWAAIDEPGHYAFVQTLAEDGRLPLLEDLVSWQVAQAHERPHGLQLDRHPQRVPQRAVGVGEAVEQVAVLVVGTGEHEAPVAGEDLHLDH